MLVTLNFSLLLVVFQNLLKLQGKIEKYNIYMFTTCEVCSLKGPLREVEARGLVVSTS